MKLKYLHCILDCVDRGKTQAQGVEFFSRYSILNTIKNVINIPTGCSKSVVLFLAVYKYMVLLEQVWQIAPKRYHPFHQCTRCSVNVSLFFRGIYSGQPEKYIPPPSKILLLWIFLRSFKLHRGIFPSFPILFS